VNEEGQGLPKRISNQKKNRPRAPTIGWDKGVLGTRKSMTLERNQEENRTITGKKNITGVKKLTKFLTHGIIRPSHEIGAPRRNIVQKEKAERSSRENLSRNVSFLEKEVFLDEAFSREDEELVQKGGKVRAAHRKRLFLLSNTRFQVVRWSSRQGGEWGGAHGSVKTLVIVGKLP